MYLIISEADVYIKGKKYLVFESTNENNELLKNIMNFGMRLNGGKTSKRSSAEYDKEFIKIKLNSDDNLPLNKTLKLHNTIIVIRSLF